MAADLLERPDIEAALEELVERCFSALEHRGVAAFEPPDAPQFLRERGIDDPGVDEISIRHSQDIPEDSPQYIPCGENDQGQCNWVCRQVKGQRECVLICHGC